VTVCDFSALTTCYAVLNDRVRPEANLHEQSGYALTTNLRKNMISDLILNIFGEIAAKRYAAIRNALWVVAAVFIICIAYGAIAS
jgi:hypothetical protein